MDVTVIFWVFLLLVFLQPVARQRYLDIARQKALTRIEERRGTRVIMLVHRQETMSLLGFPLFRYLDVNDAEQVLRAVHLTDPDRPIDLVLHTPGGLVLPSLQIARAIKRHRGKVTVVVPHYAMSGGTLVALAADEIVMSEDAALGPVDPQLGGSPAASLLHVLDTKPINRIDDNTLILADQARKAVAQLTQSVRELLDERFDPEQADELARLLSEGTWTHDFPISAELARRLGLPVVTPVPREFLELMQLYPQPMRRQPAVQYVPRRYGPPGDRGPAE